MLLYCFGRTMGQVMDIIGGVRMTKRAVVIFPKCQGMKLIGDIRDKYDPLANFILPHITLVFPFESDDSKEEIDQKLQLSLCGQSSFIIKLKGITKNIDSYGNYLFLNVTHGGPKIKNLHEVLYSGLFKENLRIENYIPHITVGKLPSVDDLDIAFKNAACSDSFLTTVDAVSVVKLSERGNEIAKIEQEITYPLA